MNTFVHFLPLVDFLCTVMVYSVSGTRSDTSNDIGRKSSVMSLFDGVISSDVDVTSPIFDVTSLLSELATDSHATVTDVGDVLIM